MRIETYMFSRNFCYKDIRSFKISLKIDLYYYPYSAQNNRNSISFVIIRYKQKNYELLFIEPHMFRHSGETVYQTIT